MSILKRAPNRVRVDGILGRKEVATSSSRSPELPFPAKRVRYPYDVAISGLTEDGSTFRLTFNSYEMRVERREDHGVETITRYYSNNCVFVQSRKKRGTTPGNEVMEKWRTAQKTLKKKS